MNSNCIWCNDTLLDDLYGGLCLLCQNQNLTEQKAHSSYVETKSASVVALKPAILDMKNVRNAVIAFQSININNLSDEELKAGLQSHYDRLVIFFNNQ